MPQLSVIVPIYNVSDYLEKCVDSILTQTFRNIEVILVNDGSKDDCGKICDCYKDADKRVVVIHQENRGLVSARKAGLEIAKGKYIAYVDGDDWIEPNMYETMIPLMEEGNELVVCDVYYDYQKYKKTYRNKLVFDKIDRQERIRIIDTDSYYQFLIMPSMCNKLFRKDMLLGHYACMPDNIAMGEDAAITMPYMATIERIDRVSTPLYHYRQNSRSMTRSYNSKYNEQIKNLICYTDSIDALKGNYYRKQMQLYYYFLSVLSLKNEALKKGTVFSLRSDLKTIMSLEWIKDIFVSTTLPNPDRFSAMLDRSIKKNSLLFASCLLKVWKIYMIHK